MSELRELKKTSIWIELTRNILQADQKKGLSVEKS